METTLPNPLAKLSVAELEQLLDAVTARKLRTHFQPWLAAQAQAFGEGVR